MLIHQANPPHAHTPPHTTISTTPLAMHFELELTQPFQTAAILQWLVVAGGSFFPFPKPNLRISTKMCSKSEQNFSFVTKPQLLILRQTVANIFPIINISNINKF